MNALELRSTIAQTEERLEVLEEWAEILESARRELVRRMPANPGSQDTQRIRAEISEIENGPQGGMVWSRSPEVVDGFADGLPGLGAARSEVENLTERLELLEEDLPTPEEIAAAEREAGRHRQATKDAGASFRASVEELLVALGQAETAAHNLADARARHLAAAGAMRELSERVGIGVTIPSKLTLGRAEDRLVRALLSLVQPVIDGGVPDPGTLGEVRRYRDELLGGEAA